MRIHLASAALAAAVLCAPAAGQLMIPDSGAGDRIMLFSKADGSLIDLNWITDVGAVGWVFTTPKEAIAVNNEIWVSDQVADAIHRFDRASREFLGSITHSSDGGTLDNIRGMYFDGSTVYLTRMHGTSSLRGVVTFAADTTPLAFIPMGTASYFDVVAYDEYLMVSSSTTNNIELRDITTGTLLTNFATGITFPQQIEKLADGSIITVSSIAAAGVEGVYHFNADGTLRRFIDTEFLKQQIGEQVPRGAFLLDDGGYLIATSIGVYKAIEVTPGSYSFLPMATGVDAQYISALPDDGPACPADWNDDGLVNSNDISAFLSDWLADVQTGTTNADFNNDGTTNSNDISAFLSAWLDAVQNGC